MNVVSSGTTDNALMARVSAGEMPMLAVLFERHHRALFGYFVSMNRNRELSEDLVQDVFFEFFATAPPTTRRKRSRRGCIRSRGGPAWTGLGSGRRR